MASLAFAIPPNPTEHVHLLRQGLPAATAKALLAMFGLPIGHLLAGLNIAVATFNRKVLQGGTLAPDESERVLGLMAMVDQVQRIVEESGNPEGFDAARWLADWISEPVPALGGTRPLDWMDTMAGQTQVRQIIGRMQTGAYS
jgi:putative toxin-antitoxin system antitoxin component (TIGR02293 family)